MRDLDFFLHRYAPTTTHLAFFKMPIDELGDRLLKREQWVNQNAQLPWTVTCNGIEGPLVKKLEAMLPLVSGIPTKTLISQTSSNWSAYADNGWRGGDVHGQPPYLGEQWGVEVLIVMMTRDVPGGQPGSMQFGWQGVGDSQGKKRQRWVSAHKESRWEFREHGERLPFEEVERYEAKRIKDRLTPEMIERYCAQFGIQLFDPDFYEGKGYIINTYPAPGKELLPKFPNQQLGHA